jgi:predicted O-methyltransferase YrrM
MLDESVKANRANMVETEKAPSDVISEGVVALREAARRGDEQMKAVSEAVNRIVPAQRIEIARAKVESVKQVEAIFQLQAFLAPEKPMPLLGGWAMEPVSMLRVVTELVTRQPTLVLECGSGTSTLWIAQALKHIGKGCVVSLEHLKEHHAATASALAAADLTDTVDLQLTPLRTHRIGNEQFKWYDLKGLDLEPNSVDFLLIDGPPKSTGPLARYPAVPLLEQFLADHALIILDDAGRPDEIEEVTRWLKGYPAFREFGGIGERTKMFTYTRSQHSDVKQPARLQSL